MAKTLVGIVTSDKPDKTIVVTVVTRKTHPLYRKQYSDSKKFIAHDEKNEAKVGDKVSIAETRPLSARKRHILDKIIEKPILRDGIVGDVEIPATEKKPSVKKAKNAETDKPETEKKTAKKNDVEQEKTDEGEAK